MPGKVFPTLTEAEVSAHNSAESCYVTLDGKVYDVTDFLDDHPGGADLILEYAGKGVKFIMEDEVSHSHSSAAYEILDESLIGFLELEANAKDTLKGQTTCAGISKMNTDTRTVYESTGMAQEADLSVETDYMTDFKTHKFLDLSKPLFPQIWYGGFTKEFYLKQVHRPRHYKGGESAPLFGNFLEPLTKTAWYVVPIVWMPLVIFGAIKATMGLNSIPVAAAYWIFGLCFWTLVEYALHRFVFHIERYVNFLIWTLYSRSLFIYSNGLHANFTPILSHLGCYRTIELVSHSTSSFTEFITIYPWTNIDL